MFYCAICGEEKSPETPMYHAKASNVRICVDCVLRLHEKTLEDAKARPEVKKIVQRHEAEQKKIEREKCGKLPAPKELKEYMDEYVIGQESAKRTLAVAVYNHYKRLQQPGIEKSNILMIGPTGSGKTLLAKTIARKLDVPFAVADATSLTQAGYVGEDVESILLQLLRAAKGDVSKAEQGIVFLDEFDKLGKKAKESMANTGAIGEGVQQALLKMLEGSVVNIPVMDGQAGQKKTIRINTKNILFICGGAFAGAATRHNTIGFGASSIAEEEDLGIIPEVMGRLPIVIRLKELNEEEMIQILYKPKNAIITQYRQLLALDGVELTFTRDALAMIARTAIARQTGARGLRSIIESIMEDVMYEVPSRPDIIKCVITRNAVEGTGLPVFEHAEPGIALSEKTAGALP